MKVNKRVYHITINTDYCKGCGICIEFCPRDVLEFSKQLSQKGYYPPQVKSSNSCTGCRLCEINCGDFAIAVGEVEQVES